MSIVVSLRESGKNVQTPGVAERGYEGSRGLQSTDRSSTVLTRRAATVERTVRFGRSAVATRRREFGMAPLDAELTTKPAGQSAGQAARLYGRRDARRSGRRQHGKQIPMGEGRGVITAHPPSRSQ